MEYENTGCGQHFRCCSVVLILVLMEYENTLSKADTTVFAHES